MINDELLPIFKYRLIVYKNNKKIRSIIFKEDALEVAEKEYELEFNKYKNEFGYRIILKDIDTSEIIKEYDSSSEIC